MEKLRQRHRGEKQRASTFSDKWFFSSWFIFETMEAMENRYDTKPANLQIDLEIHNPKSLNLGHGRRFKPSAVQNLVTLTTSSTKHNIKSRVSNHYSSYPNGLIKKAKMEVL